ncbi:MAG: hypothetical protein M9962_08005 [Oligoflexia bacterium]|nr:hypothetical protein [Oligoflexia bacterium]
MRKIIILLAVCFLPGFAHANIDLGSNIESKAKIAAPTSHYYPMGSYYDWGVGRNGYGYCYEYTDYGDVLNGGQPVGNYNCEYSRPSEYNWGQGRNGFGYCYQRTPYGHFMNEGQPVGNYNCEMRNPSYFAWGRGRNGYTYCYQYTANGYPMNNGQPVGNYNCR